MSGLLKKITPDNRAGLAGAALLLVAAWLRLGFTGNLKVDENFISAPEVYFLCAAVFLGLGLSTWPLLRCGGAAATSGWSYVGLLALCTPPFLSNDVFSYFYYGEALHAGMNVYAPFDGTHLNTWTAVGLRYKDTPAVYGLPLLLLYAGIDLISQHNLALGIMVLKGIHALAWIFLWQLFRWRFGSRPLVPFLLSFPVLWIEGLANLHNEFLLLPLVVLGILWFEYRWFVGAFFLWALATWCKWSWGLVFLWPIFHSYRRTYGLPIALSCLLALSVTAALYLTMWRWLFPGISPEIGLTGPLKTLSSLGPSSSLTDIFFTLTRLFLNEETAGQVNQWMSRGLQIFSIGLAAYILRLRRHRLLPHSLWWLTAVFLCFFSHRIMAWYFLLFIPFWWPGLPEIWRRWYLIITAVYMAQGLIQYTQPEHLFTQALTAILVAWGVALLFWNFRKRFLRAV